MCESGGITALSWALKLKYLVDNGDRSMTESCVGLCWAVKVGRLAVEVCKKTSSARTELKRTDSP